MVGPISSQSDKIYYYWYKNGILLGKASDVFTRGLSWSAQAHLSLGTNERLR